MWLQCGDCNDRKQRADAGKIERVDLVGDVKNADVIIIDDMIDTAVNL